MSVNYDRVCRLCLSSRGELVPIFPVASSEDTETPILASKIKDCVAVQINEDDQLPTCICRKCADNVNNWHIFKGVCERSQNKLQSLVKKDGSQLEEVQVKSEPLSDEVYDDGVVIDGSYPEGQNAAANKIQPEGPPILASLGLTPRSDKGADSDKEEEEEEEEEEDYEEPDNEEVKFNKVPNMPEVSITVMRPTGETLQSRQGFQQLASKNCLVCDREYRYSHNARRHELAAHGFDRYTNKTTTVKKPQPSHMLPKLRPNPFNPKARLMPNPISHKIQQMQQFNPKKTPTKMVPHKVIPKPVPIKTAPPIKTMQNQHNNLPYPLRIKALKDLQIKKKEPQILKTLLTSKPEVLVSEPEIMNSGPESPETLISEPEISSFQVETILSEPDAFDSQHGEESKTSKQTTHDNAEAILDNELELARDQEDAMDDEDRPSDNEDNVDDHDNYENDNENHDDQGDEMDQDQEETVDNAVKDDESNDEADDNEDGPDEADAGEDEDEEMPLGITPVVEINEGQQNSYQSEQNEEEEEDEMDESGYPNDTEDVDHEIKELDPNKLYVTKSQREFIQKYRNIIEQINTKRCLCCDREYPRRKAVIQHLQKNGLKVPKHTCYNCVVTFTHIGALLSHMRANVCTELWKVIYHEGGITDDMTIEDEPKENKVQYKDIFNSRSYACKLCPAKFQLKQFITKHVADVHEDGQSKLNLGCVHCGGRFKDRGLWKRHIRNAECIIFISCDLCAAKFVNIQDFNEHALAVHAGSFDPDKQSQCVDGRPTDCPICDKKNGTYQNLVKHLKFFHNEDKPHYCQNCDAKYEKAELLNKHIYEVHSNKAMGIESSDIDLGIVKEEAEEYHYSCTECNAIFETVDAWTDHQVAEHNQVAHHCDQCEKKFLRPSELAEHKNAHLKVKLYRCSLCSDSYGTPQKLSEHVQAAHPGARVVVPQEIEFYCEICIRSFKSRQAYSNHMRIHSRVPTNNRRPVEKRDFTPQLVGKPMLVQPTALQFKAICNVPNAPYSCDICGKGFMHKKNIWKHKKMLHADILNDRNSEDNTMHAPSTEEEEYNLDENGAALSTPQFDSFNFSSYLNNTSGAQPQESKPRPKEIGSFSCDLCYKTFPLKSSLFKHKRCKHGIINASSTGTPDMQASTTTGDSSRSSCTICRITFTDKKSYYRHRKNVHKSSNTAQVCKICGIPLNSTLELYEHLRAAHARELLGFNAAQAPRAPDAAADVELEYDGEQDSNDPSVDYQARYPCDTCGKQFVGLLALQNHQCVNQLPSQPQTFDCEICHKSYSSIAALKSHRGWHLRSPDGKAAANNSGLWMPQHKITGKVSKHEILDPSQLARVTHTAPAAAPAQAPSVTAAKRRLPPEVEVTVVNPNKKMRSDDSGDMDLAGGASDDRYCTICDKEFTKRAAYQRHMDEVHQPNSVFCPVCDKSFTRKSTLLVHMKKHYDAGEASSSAAAQEAGACACDVCGLEFAGEAELGAHRADEHADESADSEDEGEPEAEAPAEARPRGEFTCGQCGDGVASPHELIAHRTMHATPTKFFCQTCKVYFSRSVELSAHTRERHADGASYFPCAMCDRFYMNKKSLQRHIEMSH